MSLLEIFDIRYTKFKTLDLTFNSKNLSPHGTDSTSKICYDGYTQYNNQWNTVVVVLDIIISTKFSKHGVKTKRKNEKVIKCLNFGLVYVFSG